MGGGQFHQAQHGRNSKAIHSWWIISTKALSACMPLTLLPFVESVELPPKPPHRSHGGHLLLGFPLRTITGEGTSWTAVMFMISFSAFFFFAAGEKCRGAPNREGFLPNSAVFKGYSASSLFSFASLLNAKGRRRRGLQECWTPTEKEG